MKTGDLVTEPDPTGWCFCGCGGKTAPGKHFVQNHDRRAEANTIREHYGSIAAFVVHHDPTAGGDPDRA